MSKLSEAIDRFQNMIDSGELIDHTDHRELEIILEAAWKYGELSEEYDD